MTSPNEPGAPKKGDGLNGDGSAERAGVHRVTPPAQAGRAPDAGDSPPWQRGGARPPQAPPRQTEPPTEARPAGPPSGVEARLNRFAAGAAAPGAGAPPQAKNPPRDTDAPPGRGDGPPAEAYASELPDLSGPTRGARSVRRRRTALWRHRVRRGPAVPRPPKTGRAAKAAKTAPRCPGDRAVRCGPACRSAGSIRGAR